jgi:hypothetical protein
MNSEALTLMLLAVCTVTAFTAYFFFRVLTTKPKREPDSYSGNDDQRRD